MNVAAYIRVSSDDQTSANQRPDVEALAARHGWPDIRWYEETRSAAKSRPVFARMLADAKARRFDVLLIWSLDRFGRSMAGNLDDFAALAHAGVRVVSAREDWLDQPSAVRPLLIGIFSWVAEHERARLIERTRAGLQRARAEGVPLGREPVPESALRDVQARIDAGSPVALACAAVRWSRKGGAVVSVSPATFRRWRSAQKGSAASAS